MRVLTGLFSIAMIAGFLPAQNESTLLTKIRQLTFEGKRAGEGYFGAEGKRMVFQSERQADNPFYQIYLMDLETGDTERVSPGHGKTTCAWIHPHQNKVFFASTHLDPKAREKQQKELDFRASGKSRRYAWDYDEHFDLFEADLDKGTTHRLTDTMGYDAEGSWSPDGKWIAFASNRHAYTEKLSKKDRETFEVDKSFMMEIYIMKADGSQVKRLTHTKGYDGGPFFNPTGTHICWRRFSEDGTLAEVYTMKIDGSDQKRLTRLDAMSWAPYFHPSEDYLIFATNKHGFANFELYLVDNKGEKEPVRVTDTDGFDGLPVFSPDGKSLSWTSNRTAEKSSQIFMARWDHQAALKLLGLHGVQAGDQPVPVQTQVGVAREDLEGHVKILAGEAMEGRLTGTPGEQKATAYVASVFQAIGLEPAGDNGSYFQEFPFVAGVSLGKKNDMRFQAKNYQVDQDWRPLSFSKNGPTGDVEIAFAGYGIKAPARDGQEEYDAFVHLDVKDKWVLVFRYLPENLEDKRRQHLSRFASLRYKAMVIRNKGALGMIVANAPGAETKEELVRLAFDASLSGTGIAAISVSNSLRDALLASVADKVNGSMEKLDRGEAVMGFALNGITLSATVDIAQEKRKGRNVLGRLNAKQTPGTTALAIGAHVDHLGRGGSGNSLAREGEKTAIHFGADDNASGTAGLMEIAQYLADQKTKGKLKMKRDVLFAAWSGEELGLLGSHYFAANYNGKAENDPLSPAIAAYLNMDMIGRMKENLVLQGLGSSSIWKGEIERRNAPIGLSIVTQNDSYLPTDATSFYLKKVPILSAFTGSHSDYHSPRDTYDKLNYQGMTDIVRFMALVARGLVQREEAPDYLEMKKPEGRGSRAVMRAYLGTIPDYASGDVPGLKLSGVAKEGPADKAGLKGGDIIVNLGGKKIENIYDYTYAIEALKIGKATEVTVVRDGKKITMTMTPASRQ